MLSDAFNQPDTEPTENYRTHAFGMFHRQECRDTRAHGIAHHVGSFDFQMVEQRTYVVRHGGAVIAGRVVQLVGCAVPAIVERNHTPSITRERRHPAGLHPVHLLGGGEAVHQHNRFAIALVEIGNLDPAVSKARHT